MLKNEKPFVPLRIERGRGDAQLFVKQVTVHGARYIVCRNEAEAEKDRAVRHAIVANLEKRLSGGDKALVGNAGYRRYLRRTGAGKAFEIDAGKLAEEARFDGIFVLRTNAGMTPLNAVLRYRELLLVEDLFRRAKVQLRTRARSTTCCSARMLGADQPSKALICFDSEGSNFDAEQQSGPNTATSSGPRSRDRPCQARSCNVVMSSSSTDCRSRSIDPPESADSMLSARRSTRSSSRRCSASLRARAGASVCVGSSCTFSPAEIT